MKLHDIVREAAETIRQIEILTGVPVVEMDKGRIWNGLDNSLTRSKAAVRVTCNGFTPKIQGDTAGDGIVGTTMLSVSIFKAYDEDRFNPAERTVLEMAQAIAKSLHCAIAEGMDAPLYFKRITPIAETVKDERDTITCDVEFETTTSL